MRKKMFEQFDYHLTADKKPSNYFNSLLSKGELPHPFDMLFKLRGTEQSLRHHPEGDVWEHTMIVIDNAANQKKNSKQPRVFMWAALLHDIGKPKTTRLRRGRITAYGHDKEGALLAAQFFKACGQQSGFIKQVCALVRWHMQPLFALKNLPFFDPAAMAEQTDIAEVALLGLCDRAGRGIDANNEMQQESDNMALFIKKCHEALKI